MGEVSPLDRSRRRAPVGASDAMLRPHRFVPPSVAAGVAPRRRIQRQLVHRHATRLTLLAAGAGTGKTTALALAYHGNQLAPRGTDWWLTCQPDDIDAHQLLASIALAARIGPISDPEELSSAVASMAPEPVCLILDDLHHLGTEAGEANRLIQWLCDQLPSNAHLVLSTRREPPLALSRWEAQRELTRISPDDLLLTEDEALDIGGQQVLNLGGWPALVSLASQHADYRRFLHEEVLPHLSNDERIALDHLAALREMDSETLVALTGQEPAVLAPIPLVSRRSDGWEAHRLWSEVLDIDAGPIRAAAFRSLMERSEHHAAVELMLRTRGEDRDLLAAVREAIISKHQPPAARVSTWAASFPDQLRDSPEFSFVEGLAIRADKPSSPKCRSAFDAAAAGFRSRGDIEAEAAALGQVVFSTYVSRDMPRLMASMQRVGELTVAGSRSARQITTIGGAMLALAAGDPQAVIERVAELEPDRLAPTLSALAKWMEAGALAQLGRPSSDAARASSDLWPHLPGTADSVLWALLREGSWEQIIETIGSEPGMAGGRDRFLWLAFKASALACLGKLDEADHCLFEARKLSDATNWRALVQLRMVEAVLALQRGDISTATNHMLQSTGDHPVDSVARAMYLVAPRLVLELIPDQRDELVAHMNGPLHRRDLELYDALAAWRAGSPDEMAEVGWPEHPGEILTALFLDGMVEFLLAATSCGRPEARAGWEWLFSTVGEPARALVRRAASSQTPGQQQAASTVLAEVPVPPSEPRAVRILGHSELLIGDKAVDAADWRRERVRSLLGYLIVHPAATREAVMSALWPDADSDAARRNLRTTLNLLQRVLEPERVSGDAPYFVRSDGTTLALNTERIRVDVWEFETSLETARRLREDGLVSQATDHLDAAVDTYRGDFLADADEADWVNEQRWSLRSRLLVALLESAQAHLAMHHQDRALAHARRAAAMEPWSEPAHLIVLRSLLARGDTAEARRAAVKCSEVLAEVGGAADPELDDLLQTLSGRAPL
ncbi:MAG: BTAD domain-containing putative transcriptional regulator [Acidimicrobiales bacterium]